MKASFISPGMGLNSTTKIWDFKDFRAATPDRYLKWTPLRAYGDEGREKEKKEAEGLEVGLWSLPTARQ
jgi:hypothetical protein